MATRLTLEKRRHRLTDMMEASEAQNKINVEIVVQYSVPWI